MTRHYVVQCMYPLYYGATVPVEADTPEDAFAAAVRKAGEDGLWRNTDVTGEPFARRIREDATAVPRTPKPPRKPSPTPTSQAPGSSAA